MAKKGALFLLIITLLILICQNCKYVNDNQNPIKVYYPSGELKREMTIKDSLLHGTTFEYYKSGQKKLELEFFEDIPVNNQFHYSKNGKLVGYNFYDLRGELRFQMHWDSLNEKYSYDGKSIYIQGEFRENYSAGDSVGLIPIVANPFKSSYNIILLTENKMIKNSYDFNESKTPLFLIFINRGDNIIKIISEVNDNIDNLYKSDTITLNFIGE